MRKVILGVCTLLFCSGIWSAEPRWLVILTWEDYLHPELVREFEERHQVKVVQVFYSSDQDRTRRLYAQDKVPFDLVLTAGSDIRASIAKGWIAPIDFDQVPNSEWLEPEWRNGYFGSFLYALPYFWGTSGIAYRPDLVEEPLLRWSQLLRPAPELQGRILMSEDMVELLNISLKTLGYSLNSQDEAELVVAEDLLLEQRRHVLAYRYPELDESSALVSGEAVAAFAYNGDALELQRVDPRIEFVVPEEGTNLWADYFVLGADGNNPKLAHAFLDFISQPENAAKSAELYQLATPNRGARDFLPDEYLNNPLIYPGEQVLQRSEFNRSLTPEMMRRRGRIASQLVTEAK